MRAGWLALLPAVAAAEPAAVPCTDLRPLYQRALAAADADALWQVEAALVAAGPGCDAAAAPLAVMAPPRISAPVDLPAAPQGPGAGPWILLGVGAALAGGVIYLDVSADEARDDLAAARQRGDRAAYADARDDFELRQQIAWGLAAGAGAAALAGVLWLALGGDDDPVQTRPVFGGHGAGLGVTF